MAVAWPAEGAGVPRRSRPAGSLATSRLQGREPLTWFDREEPLGVLATLTVLLSAALLLGACGYVVWDAVAGARRGALPVELAHFRAVTDVARPAAPVRLRIPAIGVNTPLERLGKNHDGTVQVPRHWKRAGWFTGGPRPGEPGSAVLLGHYDSYCCPAVFYRLGKLRTGDRIRVVTASGGAVVFRVTRVAQYRRAMFPLRQVYFPTLRPQLRVITCAGPYLRSQGRYRDNTVVYAEQLGARAGGNRAASG